MKHLLSSLALLLGSLLLATESPSQDYTNFIRQVLYYDNTEVIPDPSGVGEETVIPGEISEFIWDFPVESSGQQLAPIPITLGGSRFELWSIKNNPLASHLLDTRYVNTFVPISNLTIRSEDPYDVVPRTRADRPFFVDVEVSGLLNGLEDPEASKEVSLLRHVQSYGEDGDGSGIDRDMASLLSSAAINDNGTMTLTYHVTEVPGGNRAKVRGEERFSVFSLADYQVPASQLASQLIQIWPVADGSVTGLTSEQHIKGKMPNLVIDLNDLYPSSRTFAQVYKGGVADGKQGVIVPGSALVINHAVPQDAELLIDEWDDVFDADGLWTLEVLTLTPFGIDRLAHVSFDLDRTIRMNGNISTVE